MPAHASTALVNKLVPCAWLLSGALEVWSLRLRLQPALSTRASAALTLLCPSFPRPLKFADNPIPIALPPLWNKLPPALRQISDGSDPFYELTKTSPLAISPQLFHSKLKTLLFNKSYPDLSSSPYLPPHLTSKYPPP